MRPESEPVAPTAEDLKSLVEAAVKRFLGTDEVHYHKDGDIRVRMGSALVLARPAGIFSATRCRASEGEGHRASPAGRR